MLQLSAVAADRGQAVISSIAEGLKSLLGLSGLAYIAGFIVTNARFLAWGVGEADLLDARYIAAGAIFLFVALPSTLFPYLRGLAELNELQMRIRNTYFSPALHTLYEGNRAFIAGALGQFLVIVVLFALLLRFYAQAGDQREILNFAGVFALWYFGSYLCSRFAAKLFNLRFYWRAKMLLGSPGFWAAFGASFIQKFRASFARSFRLSAGRDAKPEEIDAGLTGFVLRGLGPEGFLASALYKGIALLLVSATTFGAFVYPSLPVSIGGGKAQSVMLLLSAEKSEGLMQLGVPGRKIAQAGADAKNAGDKPVFQLLTSPLPLMTKTSEAYFVLVSDAAKAAVVKIPVGNVEGVLYGEAGRPAGQ